MGKQCVFLKYRIQISLVRRQVGNILTIKYDLTLIRRDKSAKDP